MVDSGLLNSPFLSQEVSIHIYEKRGNERVGRCRKKKAIAELFENWNQEIGISLQRLFVASAAWGE